MKINISPATSNSYPKTGILIKGKSPNIWLPTLQLLNINLIETIIFPVASTKANELYGCFLIVNNISTLVKQLNVSVFQSVHEHIYIPEFSTVSPILSKEDAQKLFKFPHIFQPDFGWVTLNEPIIWENILQIEAPQQIHITKPSKTVFSPQTIKSFQLIADEEIDIIKELELTVKPPKKDILTSFDKVKLSLFKSFFSSKKNNKGGFDIEGKGLLKWLNNSSNNSNGTEPKWKKDFEKLLFRNQKETDKLLSLFKSNPNLALSRALPLDMLGTSRDAGGGVFQIFKTKEGEKESPFSSFVMKLLAYFVKFSILYLIYLLVTGIINSNVSDFFSTLLKLAFILVVTLIILSIIKNLTPNSSSSGGSVNLDSERMQALRKEYEKLAEEAVKNNDYKKAASIYIKLLKNTYQAATLLEEGKFYQEAAIIHLKYNKNKEFAAKAYEKGKFYDKAIDLYKELNQNEKVGDLYSLIDNKSAADKYFQIVINNYLNNSQYVKASLVYKYKVNDSLKAQEPLLKGWREGNDSYNCLTNYFSNFTTEKKLEKGIEAIYRNETNALNIDVFLKSLKHEHTKHKNIQDYTQSIAYEVVANYIKVKPSIAYSLSSFSPQNSLLNKDTSKFVKKEKKKKRNQGL